MHKNYISYLDGIDNLSYKLNNMIYQKECCCLYFVIIVILNLEYHIG